MMRARLLPLKDHINSDDICLYVVPVICESQLCITFCPEPVFGQLPCDIADVFCVNKLACSVTARKAFSSNN